MVEGEAGLPSVVAPPTCTSGGGREGLSLFRMVGVQ